MKHCPMGGSWSADHVEQRSVNLIEAVAQNPQNSYRSDNIQYMAVPPFVRPVDR